MAPWRAGEGLLFTSWGEPAAPGSSAGSAGGSGVDAGGVVRCSRDAVGVMGCRASDWKLPPLLPPRRNALGKPAEADWAGGGGACGGGKDEAGGAKEDEVDAEAGRRGDPGVDWVTMIQISLSLRRPKEDAANPMGYYSYFPSFPGTKKTPYQAAPAGSKRLPRWLNAAAGGVAPAPQDEDVHCIWTQTATEACNAQCTNTMAMFPLSLSSSRENG